MAISHATDYRIKRNSEYEAKMLELRNIGLFNQYKDILVVSALIGYYNDTFKPEFKSASDAVQLINFKDDVDVIDFLAFARVKNQKVLDPFDSEYKNKKYEIFEGYANGGFPILVHLLNLENNKTKESLVLRLYEILIYKEISMKVGE